ncbi:MAG: hypothetical protein ACRD0O_14800 [Acidimicrobiia bacterium]
MAEKDCSGAQTEVVRPGAAAADLTARLAGLDLDAETLELLLAAMTAEECEPLNATQV